MRSYPKEGLRDFSATMAATRSSVGPFGPGLRGAPTAENRQRYFLSTSALWNRNKVLGLRVEQYEGVY
jgi:hypothetical protein